MKSLNSVVLALSFSFCSAALAQDARNPFAPKTASTVPQAQSQPVTPKGAPFPAGQGGAVLMPAPTQPMTPQFRAPGAAPIIGGSVLPPPVPSRAVTLPQLPPPTFEAPPVPSELAPLPGEQGSARGQRQAAVQPEKQDETESLKGDEAFKKQRTDALKLREQCKYELDGPSRIEISPSAQTVVVKLKGKVVPGCARAVQASGSWIEVVDQSGLSIELDVESNYSGSARRGKVFVASPGLSIEVSLVQKADPNFREVR